MVLRREENAKLPILCNHHRHLHRACGLQTERLSLGVQFSPLQAFKCTQMASTGAKDWQPLGALCSKQQRALSDFRYIIVFDFLFECYFSSKLELATFLQDCSQEEERKQRALPTFGRSVSACLSSWKQQLGPEKRLAIFNKLERATSRETQSTNCNSFLALSLTI